MRPAKQEYNNFISTIKERIRTAQYDALKKSKQRTSSALLGYW